MTAASAVIWDVDGVLIDSEPLHLEAMRALLKDRGVAFADSDNSRWLGHSLNEIWDGMPELRGCGLTFEQVLETWIDYYIDHVDATMARDPAPAVVGALATRGVPQAAASSSPRRIVLASVAAVGVADLLGAIRAREDVARGKPAPDLYLAAARALKVSPGACLAIEDTEAGVAAARAAGLRVIAWPNEMTAGMDFSAADAIVEDIGALDWMALVEN